MKKYLPERKLKSLYQYTYGIAKSVGIVFEPFGVAVVTFFLIILKIPVSAKEKLIWSLVAFFVAGLPSLLVLIYQKRKGKITDWFIRRREERVGVQLAWVAGTGIFAILAAAASLPRLLLALSLSFFIISLLITLISFYWKISVHSSVIAFSVLALILTYNSTLSFLFLLIFLVAWARVRVGAHTLSQVSAGALLSILLTYICFSLFGLATF